MIKRLLLTSILALCCTWFAPNTFAQAAGKATAEAAAAAKKFLTTLDETQRGKVVFDFKDSAQRKRWSNLPTTMVPRAGLRMGDLTSVQRDAAMAVLVAALSQIGRASCR